MDNQKKTINLQIFDPAYMGMVSDVSQYIIETDDRKKALELVRVIERAMTDNKEKFKEIKEAKDFYDRIVTKLKFIALPALNESEIIGLLRNHFTWHFNLPNYDISKKFIEVLKGVIIYEDRNKLKEEVKKVLIISNEIISSQAQIKSISDWIKNYNASLGLSSVENIKKTQYLTNVKQKFSVNDNDYQKLKILFNFYELLKLSSLTAEGFEEDALMELNDKLFVLSRGELTPIGEAAEKAKTVKAPAKSEDEEKLAELKAEAAKYDLGTLQRKAVDNEIKKIYNKGSRK